MREKAGKNKILIVIIICLCAVIIAGLIYFLKWKGGSDSAFTPDLDPNAKTQTAGSATVSYHVDPAYQVTIPVDTSMRFNETETSYGNIVVEQAQIEDGKCIQVSLLSDLNLKNSNNSKAVIPYQILAQDEAGSRPFTSAQYTKAGEETPLTIAIKKEDWKKAAAGEYADTVTFTISYVDKSE